MKDKTDRETSPEMPWQKMLLVFLAMYMLFLAGCTPQPPRDEALAQAGAIGIATPIAESKQYSTETLTTIRSYIESLGCTLPPTLQIDFIKGPLPTYNDHGGAIESALGQYFQNEKEILISDRITELTPFDTRMEDLYNLSQEQIVFIKKIYVLVHEFFHACGTENPTPTAKIFDFTDSETKSHYQLGTPTETSYGMTIELTTTGADGTSETSFFKLDEFVVNILFMRIGVKTPVNWGTDTKNIQYMYNQENLFNNFIRLTNALFDDTDVSALLKAKEQQDVSAAYTLIYEKFTQYVQKLLTGQSGYQKTNLNERFFFELPENQNKSQLLVVQFLISLMDDSVANYQICIDKLSYFIFGKNIASLNPSQADAVRWTYQNLFSGQQQFDDSTPQQPDMFAVNQQSP